jgi:hypothetical protein
MERLPETTQLLYSQLLQECTIALPNSRGISFVSKTVGGQQYWYLELVVGSTKRQFSIGRDTPELREQIEKQKALFREAVPDLQARERLVAMLVQGGAYAPSTADGRVLEVLAQAGVFLAGGVLVGSHAFTTYGNMLGIVWDSAATRTHDLDIASAPNINVGVQGEGPDVKTVLLDSGLGFFEVPALNRKSPSTSFKIRGREFQIDLLTSVKGKDDGEPVFLPNLNSYAHPMRFLEYLMEDAQLAAIPFRSGILVNVASPARYAVHKLVVSERRPATEQTKADKDRRQAAALLSVLLEDRPGDVWNALDGAKRMPVKFTEQLLAAGGRLRTPEGKRIVAYLKGP